MSDSEHSCGYHCERLECMKSQRTYLLSENERLRGIITEAEHLAQIEPGRLLWRIINMNDALKLSHRELQRAQAELADCRAWLKHYERSESPSVKQAIALARDEAYERAALVCKNYPRECSEILAARILALKSSPSALADSNTVDNSLSSDWC